MHLKPVFFYQNQNNVIMLLICTNLSEKIEKNENKNSLLNCKIKINENKMWLNKNNYKKLLYSNNKTVYRIIQNIISEIKKIDNTYSIKNISIILNFLKNFSFSDIITIRDTIYKNFISDSIISNNTKSTQITNKEEELISPEIPFIKDDIKGFNFTLVLDLDETLVHYVEDDESAFIQIRPGAEIFLSEMSKIFEIVVFTAAMQDVTILLI